MTARDPYRHPAKENTAAPALASAPSTDKAVKKLRKSVYRRAEAGEFPGEDYFRQLYEYSKQRSREILTTGAIEDLDIEVKAFGVEFSSALTDTIRDMQESARIDDDFWQNADTAKRRATQVLEQERLRALWRIRRSAEREHFVYEVGLTIVATISIWRLMVLAGPSAFATILVSLAGLAMLGAGFFIERMENRWKLETAALFLLHRRLDQLSPPSEDDELNSRFYNAEFWNGLGSPYGSPDDPARMLLRGKEESFGRSHFATKMLAVPLGPHIRELDPESKARTAITIRRLLLIPYLLYHLGVGIWASF